MATPVITFPDAELVIGQHILSSIPGLAVVSRVPEDRPAEFVSVKRIGGLRRTVATDRPRIDVHCWSDTDDNAIDLMRRVRAYVLAMAGQHGTTRVYDVSEVGGPQELTDSISGQPRYAFAVEFSTRGKEL